MNSQHICSAPATASRRAVSGAAALALLLLSSAGVAGAEGWSWTVTPYAWATDVGINATLDGREIVDEQISVSDLLEDLDTIVQVRLEAQYGAHGVMLDLFDVTLSDEVSGLALPQGSGTADMKSDMGMTILDLAGLYDPQGDRQGFVFFYGARVINERITVDAAFEPTSGPTTEQRYEGNDTFVDGLVGVRFSKRFARRWTYQVNADLSTGGTDYTWSISPTLSYAFGQPGRYALTAGYRRMHVDFDDEQALDTRMTLSGLLVGFSLSF